ncbi:MAG: hypothetical protein M0Z60_04975, partial [Nitrospiraceae bacterium]|nr:hypothetical protein [Nitrospiraceae bacterium]
DEYIEDHDISTQLIDKIEKLKGGGEPEKPAEPPAVETGRPAPPVAPKPEPAPQAVVKPVSPPEPRGDVAEKIEKAKRLARTIINDIYLYNSAKLDDSLRNDNFYAAFSAEVKEGKKLYDLRIPQEIRDMGDFYKEAIENFISARKKTFS